MNTVTLSTEYSKAIKVKNKTFVLYMHEPSVIEVYGNGARFKLNFQNTAKVANFDYSDEFIWEACKQAKKEQRKAEKIKMKQKNEK